MKAARQTNLLLVGLLVLLAGVVVSFFTLPDRWRWPIVAGAVLALFTAGFTWIQPSRWSRVVVLTCGGLITAAVVLLWHEDTRGVALSAAVPAILLLPLAVVALSRSVEDVTPPPLRSGQVLTQVVLGVALVATTLGVVGWYERGEGAFVVSYGTRVTASLADTCTDFVNSRTGSEAICEGSWVINGHAYSGYVHLERSELGVATNRGIRIPNTFTATSVTAYAMPGDDDAYTARHRSSDPDGLQWLGFVPWWTVLALPALGVGVWSRRWLLERRATRRAATR